MRRCALGMVLVLLVAACSGEGRDVAVQRAPIAPSVTVAETAPPSPPPTTTPVPEAAPTTPATAPLATAPPAPAPAVEVAAPAAAPGPVTGGAPFAALARQTWTSHAYEGFGAWLDAYDWSQQFTRSPDVVTPADIDHMADEGVQTVYIQASRWNSPTDVLEPDRLQALIDRAHARGMAVVAWYLPTLEDPGADLRRILAVAGLGIEGVAIDIEARDVADVGERNRRLIELSRQLRASLPGRAIGAIVLEPVLLEDVNPGYWPSFPWAEIRPYYDVWMPMSYWTNRRGPWRAAHDYTADNMARLRQRIGDPNAPVHPIGGIGDKTTVEDLQQMVAAAVEQHAIGGSIYDYRTSRPEFWATLRSFRS